jgi:polysaccharide pyruvyl transferase WcaK-like protein
VLILHAYSADNAGDGLLVRETLNLLREALGTFEATMLASRPSSFADLGIRVLPTVPTLRGWQKETRAVLRAADNFDLVVGVGGGYLRSGTAVEALKAGLVMGPQLIAAARTRSPTLYLPQSIGPARFGTRRIVSRLLRRIDCVMVRDDRSLEEFAGPTLVRVPDLATGAVIASRASTSHVEPVPVVSIRSVRGRINPDLHALAERLKPFDGYVQSTVGGNDDRPAMSTLTSRRVLARDELMNSGGAVRVVVAVRLHAALMALAAGHYVIHLAYERKGFGAFADLHIEPWVHSVNSFDVDAVASQVQALVHDAEKRRDYDERLMTSSEHVQESRADIVSIIQRLIGKSIDRGS